MPRRNLGLYGKLELTQAPALAPLAQQVANGMMRLVHAARLNPQRRRFHYPAGNVF
jgi:hypothetical protein